MANRNATSLTAPVGGIGWYRSIRSYGGSFAIVTGDLVTANTVTLFRVPKGFTVTGFRVDATDMDSNGSPAVTLSIGDAGSAGRFVAASTIAQAGGTVTGNIATTGSTLSPGMFYKFTADTDILATFPAGSATAVAGTILVHLEGYIDN
jgi:hypothetical protein